MNKLTLFLLAMVVYYILVVVVISKLFIIPIMKVMALIFFIGAGYIFSRKMRRKLQ
ncbi:MULTISPECIES: hypothetical protein [Lysinibacillus]|uniref:Uncharacterized protein n=1 Tax=Lysinibacillus capsici TaxID=2115968 RepID=A0A2X0XP51_9BACI|nr:MULTISPECIES: hypothetical protein [Lysinibacillus]MBX8946736.1 hypothetical protein [Lysinibacillus sp. K60]MCM0623083.1 hypothetical protein [Lysinibacillus sp. OL1_EC]MCR6522648.1 hypothetical protein [Lysinibacillus capsici]MCS1390934.1 hypothetical protein [Lysinibacillus boronitolerans]MCS5499855.1 hypothetical protein [Lysinibacillus sp. A4]